MYLSNITIIIQFCLKPQDKCIQFMIRSLKDPKQFNLVSKTYLNADMIQFLCEPLLSINTPLIQ